MGMIGTRLAALMIMAALCLGVMVSVLLAQEPEDTEPLITFDCSPEGLINLTRMIETEYSLDFVSDPTTLADHLYKRGLSYQLLSMECGHVPNAAESRETSDKLHEMAGELDFIQAQSIGTDPLIAMIQIVNLPGDPLRGEALYNAEERTTLDKRLGCVGCHAYGVAAPDTDDIWYNVVNIRIYQPELIAHIPEYYLVESIIKPDAYIVPGYFDTMPHSYGTQMSAQDLADIVEYLHSLSPDYEASDARPSGIDPRGTPR